MHSSSSREFLFALMLRATVALGLLVFGFAQTVSAQNAAPTPLPLSLSNNYLVSGDYVVGGWVITPGTSDGTTTTGTITIPDPMQPVQNGVVSQVPKGADIVAVFLYWGTVESRGTFAGKQAFFRGYPITGTPLGNLQAPVSWSSGGCVGAANGSKTMQIYRADVRPYLPIDANGTIQPNTTYEVKLADTARNTPPFPLGATIVMIYRTLAATIPLNAVVIYDGAFAPSNTSQIVIQPMLGFYQAGFDQTPSSPPVAKITHIVGNGQTNKVEAVTLNSVTLPSLYPTPLNPTLPPFPGIYNGSWDNPTWIVNQYGNAVKGNDSLATTVVTPSISNKGCVNWGAVIFSTTVQDSDHDGLLDAWKTTTPRPGYCDAGANRGMSNQGMCRVGDVTDPSWVDLPGATLGEKDLFIQLDYMCTKVIDNANGTTTCDTANGGISYAPSQQALDDVTNAFSANGHNIHVHVATDNNHVILARTCQDNTLVSPPLYCSYPGQAGVVRWKAGFAFFKDQPLNYPDEASCETQTPPGGTAGTGPICVRRFQPGGRISRHEVIFGVALGVPNWRFLGGTLQGIAVAAPGVVTFTTANPHGLVPATGIGDTNPNARVTVTGAISNLKLNGTYLVQSVPTPTSFTIQNANATTAPTQTTDPHLAVASGRVGTRSGFSDIGGAHSLVTLGLWGADGQTRQVQSGTLMHELGHAIGLTHGGLRRVPVTGGYAFTFESNCKPNFQSVMNYMFQVDLLTGGVLDYSDQELPLLDENGPLSSTVLANADHLTTKWYAPNQPVGSPATRHCDGTPLLQTDQPMFRLQGPTSSIPWSGSAPPVIPQDINFDGKIETGLTSLGGYNDWDNINLQQVSATGNDFWVGGGDEVPIGGGDEVPVGGGDEVPVGGGDEVPIGGGDEVPIGGGEQDVATANSSVRTPSSVSATLNSSNSVKVTWTPPTLFQSLISGFNIYRSKNGGPFSQLPPNPTVSVPPGTPLPLPTTFNFIDSTASCATFTYFVTTVITDTTVNPPVTRESVASNTSNPISVPCVFVGFLSPLSTASTAPAAPTFSGPRNLGNAVPIKWELLDANGMPISDLSTLNSMRACPTTGPTTPPGTSSIPPCVLIFSPITGGEGSTTFRFSSPDFIINWDTGSLSGLAPGFWTIELQLTDGRVEWTTLQF